ncbi:MAG TPA: N-dimethylarginine dimethylaminohydrolase [Glaciibacter sp.]|nr:N-dimethylarginine dimethylaminohydrolase [Glaciibacter sp.]
MARLDSQTTVEPDAIISARVSRKRTYLMCPPHYFTVSYAINPFMDPTVPTDTARALRQWETVRQAYLDLGHDVEILAPVEGLVDMVFAANGGFTIDGRAYVARFAYPERAEEADSFRAWFGTHGFETHGSLVTNEGEGDFAFAGGVILAGYGFRSTLDSHRDLARIFCREVLSLRLVDDRFYHLDVALTVLDSDAVDGPARIAYFPGAFDEPSQALLAERFPDSILVSESEAAILALNSVSDGRNVVVAEAAVDYIRDLTAAGYLPVPVDLSELLKGGGGVKCITQELRT